MKDTRTDQTKTSKSEYNTTDGVTRILCTTPVKSSTNVRLKERVRSKYISKDGNHE